ncbi:MAG: hypothetical protein H8E37_08290 [Planctomycetes bacterium]|nr:hypothetical protein [Planctomycetota bacterium]
MSRAYRIKVSESLCKVLRASDHVSTQLELLDILPCEEMVEVLAAELIGIGFEQTDDGLVRKDGEITVTIDPETGTVTVTSESAQDISLSSSQQGFSYEEQGAKGRDQVREQLKKKAQEEMADAEEARQKQLQKEVTDQLEAELVDVQQELGQAVNRATAEALKRKASRIGQIKEMTEDPESGSITIVLEV